ncbi:hypothetical protein EV138_0036 [Kribbella voronezhensis]|uniref:Uncharacterized protein n=1 Tax=Kribbella voronezhensis TaxID=2512212 RepID=A0A4R7T644_9ACTN|nr:hypothetical protein [Kribbella voronezhensis]TDU86527.1 hypothetical protein EV138_0036 [Kribbella voronezhensis]
MTDDLRTNFEVLTDARPEPPDPAAPIRLRIKSRRRRRRGTAVVLVTAAAVGITLGIGPALHALQPDATGGIGVAEVPTPPPTSPSSSVPSSGPSSVPTQPAHNKVLPPPWSDKQFTKVPDSNSYRPAYFVAQGEIPTEKWAMISTQDSCLVSVEGKANSFGGLYDCFTDWTNGQKVSYRTTPAYQKEKDSYKINYTMVIGATSIEARTVRIKAGGKTYVTDAVGTPTSNKIRFFSVVIPQRDAKLTSITPLDATGRPAPAPSDPPTALPCNNCGTTTGNPSAPTGSPSN